MSRKFVDACKAGTGRQVTYMAELGSASVHLSEGRGQNNQQPTPNDNKSEWWSSFVVLVFNLCRGMCCTPSGKVQEGREGLLMGDICDWGWY